MQVKISPVWVNLGSRYETRIDQEVRLIDNQNLVFGGGGDATIDYNGTNLVIDPKVVGSGNLLLNAGSLDLNNQGSILNVGDAGNDWTDVTFQINNSVASNKGIHLMNTSTSSGAGSRVFIRVEPSAAGAADPCVWLEVNATNSFVIGADNSDSGDRFVIGHSTSNAQPPGTNDGFRMTGATPPVITYNTTHHAGTFDYVCEACGEHGPVLFECCGPVKWHDDVMDFRAMVLRNEPAIDYMAKIGVMERTFNNDGEPEVFTKLGPDWLFVGAMAYQNRQRMDAQYEEINKRLEAIGA